MAEHGVGPQAVGLIHKAETHRDALNSGGLARVYVVRGVAQEDTAPTGRGFNMRSPNVSPHTIVSK
jgi:hypothetical protein